MVGYVKIAIENGHLEWIFPLNMVIFNSYVKLPEGIQNEHPSTAIYSQLGKKMVKHG